MYSDRKYEAELNAAAEAAGEAAAGAFGGEAEGGLDIDAPDDEGGIDLPAPDEVEAEIDIDEPEEEPDAEEPLLAAPAKRDDRNRRTTKNSQTARAKGKKYVSKDLRGGDGRKIRRIKKECTRCCCAPSYPNRDPGRNERFKDIF